MKAVDSRKGNTHLLANMTVIRVGTSVAKNVMIKTAAYISVIPSLMNVDLQYTGGKYELRRKNHKYGHGKADRRNG